MDPIGFTIGVAALAGTFTACVDCFEYIQLGRKFGQNYGQCILKLDATKVRMYRWRESLGFGDEPRQPFFASEKEIKLARGLLEQIMDCFDDAERISERFKKHATETADLAVYDAQSDLDPNYQRLHLTMRELANKRQRGTSMKKKTTWALYEKKRFDRLIEDVTGFVDKLIELFPAAQDHQKKLCKIEVYAIKEAQGLALLKDVACANDKMLEEAVDKEVKSRGHITLNWEAKGQAKVWIGDDNGFGIESKGHHSSAFSILDHADVHIGNINRAQSYVGNMNRG